MKAVSSKSFLISASLLVPPTRYQPDLVVTGLGWETSVPRFRNYQMLSMLPLHTSSTYITLIVVMGKHKQKTMPIKPTIRGQQQVISQADGGGGRFAAPKQQRSA